MQDIIRRQLQESIRLELDHATTLRRSVLRAQEELRKELEKVPDKFLYSQMQTTVNQMADHLDSYLGGGLDAKASLELGLKSSQPLVAASAEIPGGSAYWNFSPVMPIRAIGLANSEYIKLIQKVTEDLKVDIMAEVKLSLTLGEGIGALRERVLGTGIPGLIGKDSKFRPAALRAEYIGRTVTNDLVNRGALEGYRQINKEFPQLNIRKEWGSQSDRRTSKICLDLNGQVRLLDEDFQGNFWSGPNPPSHPNCRSRCLPLADSYQSIYEREWKNKPAPTEKPGQPSVSTATTVNPLSDKLPKLPQFTDPNTYKHYTEKASNYLGDTEADLDKTLQKFLTKHQGIKQKLLDTNKAIQAAYDDADYLLAANLEKKEKRLAGIWAKVRKETNEPFETKLADLRQKLLERGAPPGSTTHIDVSDRIPGFTKSQLRKEISDYSALTQGKGLKSLDSLKYTEDRAYALRQQRYVNLGNSGRPRVIYHEIGHFAEMEDPRLARASRDFYLSRATGEPEKLSKLTGISGYRDSEVAYPDNFISPYVGKEYPIDPGIGARPTEVYSMGIEYFTDGKKMSELYTKDKEHFMYILGTLI